jgi:hypothetical protein
MSNSNLFLETRASHWITEILLRFPFVFVFIVFTRFPYTCKEVSSLRLFLGRGLALTISAAIETRLLIFFWYPRIKPDALNFVRGCYFFFFWRPIPVLSLFIVCTIP